MRLFFYPRLALTGMTRNRKTYLPYFLACSGMVMMYYIVSYLSVNDEVGSMSGGTSLQSILSLGTYVIFVLALIVLFYAHSFLIRRRCREFGLYSILGMGKRHIAAIMLWENLIIAVSSLVFGLVCGVLFSKAAQLLMAKLLGAESSFSFTVESESVVTATLLFAFIFLVITVFSVARVRITKPVELLKSNSVGERPPKANYVVALIGAVMLGVAYYMAITIDKPLTALMLFFTAVILVIIATYLLFISGSVALCRLLQKNKRFYYRTSHFISVSSMTYRMKRAGASLASICILCTMVMVMISSTASLYYGKEDSLNRMFPRDYSFRTYSDNDDMYAEIIDNTLAKHSLPAQNVLHYRCVSLTCCFDGTDRFICDSNSVEAQSVLGYDNLRDIVFITLSDYNASLSQSETLLANEVLVYESEPVCGDTLKLDGIGEYSVKKHLADVNGLDNTAVSVVPSMCVIVPDMETMVQIRNNASEKLNGMISVISTMYQFDVDADDETRRTVSDDISKEIEALRVKLENADSNGDSGLPTLLSNSVAESRDSFYAEYGGLFFFGMLLGLVFLAAAVLIIYYKQITEGYEDQSRFAIMEKVGMTATEVRKTINSQILTVFFMPLIATAIHVAAAFTMVSKLLALFGLTNIELQITVTAICFVIFAIFYVAVYFLTSRAYYGIVRSGEQSM